MHILEFMRPNKTFSASEVIQEEITELMVELYQYKQLCCKTDEEKEIVQGWRDQLQRIRCAVSDVLKNE